ncbi:MAG: radical SAM family heme chaperone HemW [Halioglobus sp.]
MTLPPLSVYVHLPWCERKCPYCDFNSHETQSLPEAEYVESILQDLEEDLQFVEGREIVSIFIGGGTPSLFSVEAIEKIVQGIGGRLTLAKECEITMEANPGSAEARKFEGFFASGVNRLSLGVQSFNDAHLGKLGRVHSAAQAHQAIEYLHAAGFENFNLDLMHGLPGQTLNEAEEDLKQALAYKPTHLSWYQLTIEPNTVFYSSAPTLPEELELASIQDSGEALLASHEMHNYEVSAYGRLGEFSRHNINYWSFGDYLGLGAGAHSKITHASGSIRRFSRLKQPESYLRALPTERRSNQRVLTEEDKVGEFMLNALRLTDGFKRDSFESRTGISYSLIAERVDSLVSKNLLDSTQGNVSTTVMGRRFLDTVVEAFF